MVAEHFKGKDTLRYSHSLTQGPVCEDPLISDHSYSNGRKLGHNLELTIFSENCEREQAKPRYKPFFCVVCPLKLTPEVRHTQTIRRIVSMSPHYGFI